MDSSRAVKNRIESLPRCRLTNTVNIASEFLNQRSGLSAFNRRAITVLEKRLNWNRKRNNFPYSFPVTFLKTKVKVLPFRSTWNQLLAFKRQWSVIHWRKWMLFDVACVDAPETTLRESIFRNFCNAGFFYSRDRNFGKSPKKYGDSQCGEDYRNTTGRKETLRIGL